MVHCYLPGPHFPAWPQSSCRGRHLPTCRDLSPHRGTPPRHIPQPGPQSPCRGCHLPPCTDLSAHPGTSHTSTPPQPPAPPVPPGSAGRPPPGFREPRPLKIYVLEKLLFPAGGCSHPLSRLHHSLPWASTSRHSSLTALLTLACV